MRPDEIFLLDMLLAARDGLEFLRDCPREAFDRDRMRQLAVIKSIEIVGEAAAGISEEFRSAHPELPWRDIVGMRHRLVHDYFEVDLDQVWKTAREDLPQLIAVVEKLVPPED